MTTKLTELMKSMTRTDLEELSKKDKMEELFTDPRFPMLNLVFIDTHTKAEIARDMLEKPLALGKVNNPTDYYDTEVDQKLKELKINLQAYQNGEYDA